MKPTLQVELKEFQQAARECMLVSKRELSKAINARMFFLFVRVFALLPPQAVNAARQKIRQYLMTPIGEQRISKKTGKRVGRGRQLQRRHLIVQSKQKNGEGLYGEEMKDAAAAFARRAIGSIGYLKSAVVRALRRLNGHFTQYGSTFKKGRRAGMEGKSASNPKQVGGVNVPINKYGKTQANAALLKVNAEYGFLPDGNVGVHKGAKSSTYPARPSLDPTAMVQLSIGIADDQLGRVTSIYDAAMSRALRDETVEMRKHLAAVGQGISDQFSA